MNSDGHKKKDKGKKIEKAGTLSGTFIEALNPAMFSDAGSFTVSRRHRALSMFVSLSFLFLFVSVFLHRLIEIVGLWASSAVEGFVRRLRCRIKALCFLILICNPFPPSTAMLGPDLVLTSCVCWVPCSTLRPDLTARRLLLSSLCWKMTSLPSEKTILELLCIERDISSINSSCFRSVYGDLCLWGSTIYPVAGSENSTSGILVLLLRLFHSSSYASRTLCEVPELCRFAPRKYFNSNNPGLCSLISSSTDSDVNWFSCAFAIALCRQYGNIGSGRLWRTLAFTLQSNLIKLLPLFAGAVVKTYQTPPCGQERPLPRSSFVEEKVGQLFVSPMRGSLCPDPIPVNLTTVLTVLVRTKVLKCLSKSQVKVTILKLEAFEVRWEFFVILSASGSFEDLSNTLSTLTKLVYLSFYRFSCFAVVATRLAHRICPMMRSSHVTD